VQWQTWEEDRVVECMSRIQSTRRWVRKSFWERGECSWRENQHWLIDHRGFSDGYNRLWWKESSPG
jgi:hypothetical protein